MLNYYLFLSVKSLELLLFILYFNLKFKKKVQPLIVYYRLKCCINWENKKNNIKEEVLAEFTYKSATFILELR
jgi:hypothetical protein